jgi:hypothetical protein
MMEAVRTSETSVDNHFTRQYIPEDNSEHHTSRRENLKSHFILPFLTKSIKSQLSPRHFPTIILYVFSPLSKLQEDYLLATNVAAEQ